MCQVIVMREFDQKLLNILKTEMPGEKRLREDLKERNRYMENIGKGSGNPAIYAGLKNPVSVGRQPRYVEWPVHRNYMLQINYMVSGETVVHINNTEVCLKEGDFFIPNQYTEFSRDILNENDIMVSFLVKPGFVEEVCTKIREDTVLSAFFMDCLKKNIIWNRYLHFSGIDDLCVLNQVETILQVAFPYVNEENIGTGVTGESELLKTMMMTLLALLSRNLDTISTDGVMDYDDILKDAVEKYIRNEYSSASLQELSGMVNQSESVLSRQIKRIFGCTFKDLLVKSRFERAKVLLAQTDLPIADIAVAVGYENTSFFYRRFRKLYGKSPKEYRNQKI